MTSVNSVWQACDINGSFGGPLAKEQALVLFTGHRKTFDQVVLGSFYPDGSGHRRHVDSCHAAARADQLAAQARGLLRRQQQGRYHTHSAGEDILTVSQTRGSGRRVVRATRRR